MPLVSVVVSAYNRPAMLRTSINSLFAQTFGEFEIILHDDSTTADCEQLVAQMDDRRIHYTRNKPSLGTLQNLRAGYRKCTGKYVCTLNDDDLYAPTYLATMVAGLEANPECCLAFCDHFIVDDAGVVDQAETDINSHRFGRDRLLGGVIHDALEPALLTKVVPGMFAMYRREMVDFTDFPDEVSSGYDFWLTYLAVRSGHPIFYCPERLNYYRVHVGSQTSSFNDPQKRLRSLAYDLFTHQRFKADWRLASIRPAVSAHLAMVHAFTGTALLRLGRRGAAIKEFAASLLTQPKLRPLIGLVLTALPTAFANKVLKYHGHEGL